jgi:hypothetical protein
MINKMGKRHNNKNYQDDNNDSYYDEYDQQMELTGDQQVEEIETILLSMDNEIRAIWNNIVLQYKNDINNGFVLDKLSDYDHYKFHDFFINNNVIYQSYKTKLDKLKKIC